MDSSNSTVFCAFFLPQDGWVYNLVHALTKPTLLITKDIGSQLKNLTKSETVVVRIDFTDIFEKRTRVSLEYWTTSSQLTDVDKKDQEFKADFMSAAKVCKTYLLLK